MNRDRVSDWLTTMPTYRQAIGRLVANTPDGNLSYCGTGTACARAAQDPHSRITLGVREYRWGGTGPAFVVLGVPHADRHYAVYEALEQWLGLDLLTRLIHLDALPPFLAATIRFYLPMRPHGDGWALWELNDNLVPLHLQRDALRVMFGVDADQVVQPVGVGAR